MTTDARLAELVAMGDRHATIVGGDFALAHQHPTWREISDLAEAILERSHTHPEEGDDEVYLLSHAVMEEALCSACGQRGVHECWATQGSMEWQEVNAQRAFISPKKKKLLAEIERLTHLILVQKRDQEQARSDVHSACEQRDRIAVQLEDVREKLRESEATVAAQSRIRVDFFLRGDIVQQWLLSPGRVMSIYGQLCRLGEPAYTEFDSIQIGRRV